MSLREWWQRPIRKRDRINAFFIGACGGLWAGLFAGLFVAPMPVSIPELAYYAFGGSMLFAASGTFFPRIVTLVLYPFTLLSFGGSN